MAVVSKREELRVQVLALLDAAEREIPTQRPPLPESDADLGKTAYRPHEKKIWGIGESIRQLVTKAPALRNDHELQERIVAIATDHHAQRGRQSFVMLLKYKACVASAARLAAQLDDATVAGHVVAALYKMKAAGFAHVVQPFVEHPRAWIRREAKRYVAWDATQT